MIDLTKYTNYLDKTDPAYPGFKAINTSDDESFNGTPWDADWFNTILGFFQALIMEAYGEYIISSTPDKVGNSDLLKAVLKIIDKKIKAFDAPGDGPIYGRKPETWIEIINGGGYELSDAIKALKFYSEKTLTITNTGIIDRRKRGWDIGIPYLSENGKIYHFDTDLLNQNQESNINIVYNGDTPVLMGREDTNGKIYFNPAVLDIVPHEMIGKSLYGKFSIISELGTQAATADFFIRLMNDENLVVLRLSSASESIIFNLGGEDPVYSSSAAGDVEYSHASPGDIPYSTARVSKSRIDHVWSGGSESVYLDDLNINIIEKTWIHTGIVLTENNISIFLDTKQIVLERKAQNETMSLQINEDKDDINIDELMIDGTTAITFETFVLNTMIRIPWAGLNYLEKWFVFEAQDVNKVKTNLFDTDEFKAAVEAVIANQTQGD